MTIDYKALVHNVPNFPKQGIMFYDITPVLRTHFAPLVADFAALLSADEWNTINAVAGIEARGFIFAAALAQLKGKGFVPIRKAGKLPNVAARVSYGLEYGKDTLEMQQGSGRLLIVDDVLATGGTLKAAADAAAQVGYSVAGFAAVVNLSALNNFAWQQHTARALLTY